MNRDEARHVQETLKYYRNDYMESLPETFDNIEKQVRHLSSKDNYHKFLEALCRDVHSLKGTSGTYDLQIISIICHQLEDELIQFKSSMLDHCLKYITFLHDALDRAKATPDPNYDDILDRLYRYQKMVSENKMLGVLVDPSRMNIQLIQGLLKPYPIKLTVMNDGLAALSRLLFVKYDFIIVSKELPSLDGTALIKALHGTNCSNRNTKTLLISSSSTVTESQQAIDIIKKDTSFSENIIVEIKKLVPQCEKLY